MIDVMSTQPDPEEDETLTPSSLKTFVVGLGASAGGLKALQNFFEQMPDNTGMAFVVVLHLSSKHESHAAEILQKLTGMTVSQVNGTVPIEPDHVYVIPPGMTMRMNDDHLTLLPAPARSPTPTSINLFFRTLAQVHRSRAVAVVLSGTGADGAVGLTRIKEFGGITFAQEPTDAEFDGMPRSSIATGMVDFVLPVAALPKKLIQVWENAKRIRLPGETEVEPPATPGGTAAGRDSEALRDIMVMLRSRTGHDFQHYKRATVLRRIERRLQVNALRDLPSYRDFLQGNPGETPALLNDMLISVTNFFRDRDVFESLDELVIQPIFEGRDPADQVRFWSAGCATGQEAYSLAILLAERASKLARPPELQVFATDIDDAAIAAARQALYPESIATDVSATRLREFFSPEAENFRVRKHIRERVLFAKHNLLRDPPFSKLDLISCRNLLIYLDREVQSEILEIFQFALRPGGHLLLGSSESADAMPQLFTVVDKKNRIYRANAVPRIGRTLPTMPLGQIIRRSPMHDEPAPAPRTMPFAELYQKALMQNAPPSVLVDQQHLIVHMSEGAGRFLRHVSGTPTHDLIRLIDPILRLDLRTSLFQATDSRQSVDTRPVRIERDGHAYLVGMKVRPLNDEDTGSDYTLIVFEETPATAEAGVGFAATGDDEKDRMVRRFEEELQKGKEQLQTVIEQSETANEELKASNEELQAINEELRSATEELETSREELQSVNEELVTVNYELKIKVEETSKINDDLQNLISSTEIATIFINAAMRIQRYTPRALELFNMIGSDLGRPLSDITHRLEYPSLVDDAADVFTTLRPVEREVRGSNNKWYIARILPYRTTEDRIDGAVLTFIDISRLKTVEERMRTSEEQMRLVAETTSDYAIFTMDNDGIITSWNLGAERMYGYTESEAIGKPASLIYMLEDRMTIPVEERRIARLQSRCEIEHWQQRKDGSRFFCGAITTLLGGNHHLGFAKIGRDLTLSRQFDAEREAMLVSETKAREAAQAAIAQKDEFLAVMSHELKHPLNLIQVNVELLSRLPEVSEMQRVARISNTIRNAVTSQAHIIDDMLDLTRLDTGKLALNRQPFDWTEMLDAAMVAAQADAQNKDLAISLDKGSDSVVVLADSSRVEQIVWNLLSNAIKFTPGGGRIELKSGRDGQFARLDIHDTGIGIKPEFITHVFEMFRQSDSGTTRKQGGLGIGLALVKQLAELHGGRVRAESEGLGKGACFSVWLPLHRGDIQAVSAATEARPELSAHRLLLVDDAKDALHALADVLTMIGLDVTTACSGTEALEIASARDFDLLISDIGMPDMDGYQFISAFRKGGRCSSIPAIALTGYGRQNDAAAAIDSGFNAHLGKPVSLEALQQLLHHLMTNGQAPG